MASKLLTVPFSSSSIAPQSKPYKKPSPSMPTVSQNGPPIQTEPTKFIYGQPSMLRDSALTCNITTHWLMRRLGLSGVFLRIGNWRVNWFLELRSLGVESLGRRPLSQLRRGFWLLVFESEFWVDRLQITGCERWSVSTCWRPRAWVGVWNSGNPSHG